MAEAVSAKRSSSELSQSVLERLLRFLKSSEMFFKQLNQKENFSCHRSSSTMSVEIFHKSLVTSINGVSTECTKLSVLFSKPPCPTLKECNVICNCLDTALSNLLTLYNGCNANWGQVFFKEVRDLICSLMNSVMTFVSYLMNENSLCDSRQRLQGTGSVWEVCSTVKTLSKDNKSAVLRVCLTQLELLRDASKECEELCQNNGILESYSDDDEPEADDDSDEVVDQSNTINLDKGWNNEEQSLCLLAANLVKFTSTLGEQLCRHLVKQNNCSEPGVIASMDLLAACIVKISPLVDELVSSMEVPLTITELCHNFHSLHRLLEEIFKDLSKSCCFHGSPTWPAESLIAQLLQILKDFDSYEKRK